MVNRQYVNEAYPFDGDDMTQDDYDDLAVAMHQNDHEEIRRIVQESEGE